MKEFDYKGFLSDLGGELVHMTKDQALYAPDSEFSQGYKAALYAVIHLIELQALSWEIEKSELGLGSFCSDEWRMKGASYWISQE